MNAMVVDDMLLAVNNLIKVLSKIDPQGRQKGLLCAGEALEYLQENHVDVAFLDIEMPDMNGLALAKKIKDIRPQTNIIFVTGYCEYALEAHGLYVSGFLMKPVVEEKVVEALANLRHPIRKSKKRIWVQCFGNFEVFVDGKPLAFKRRKTKELFAYLIDRKGANCTMGELIAVLWEDKPDTVSQRNQLRNLISDLRQTFKKVGLKDVIVKSWNILSVDPGTVDCDYYGFLGSDPVCVNSYTGEYMTQYSWAEMTMGFLYSQND